MKLGPQLDPVSPISLVGLVDVYNTPAGRVARQWPRPPKQPRTPEQVAHWAKFADSIAWRKALPGWWIDLWKTINPPAGYSYDDLLRRSYWRQYPTWDPMPWPDGPHWKPYYCEVTWQEWYPKGLWICMTGDHTYRQEFYWPYYKPAPDGRTIPFDWYIYGYTCYQGKKKRPQWAVVTNGWTKGVGGYRYLDLPFPGMHFFLGPRYPEPLTLTAFRPLRQEIDKPVNVRCPQWYNNNWPLESQL